MTEAQSQNGLSQPWQSPDPQADSSDQILSLSPGGGERLPVPSEAPRLADELLDLFDATVASELLTDDTDWMALARRLDAQNRELTGTVAQLEQALADCQKQLQEGGSHSFLAGELDLAKAEIARLNQQLADSQGSDRGPGETLAAELKASQERVAQLERECSLLKEASQENQEKLLGAEKHVRELLCRLQRQQRYALQYKSVLKQHGIELPSELAVAGAQVAAIPPWSSQPAPPVGASPEAEAAADAVPPAPESPSEGEGGQRTSTRAGSKLKFPPPSISRQRPSGTTVDLPAFVRRSSRS